MIKAIIFDFFGVIVSKGQPNTQLLDFIRAELRPKFKISLLSNSSRGILDYLEERDWHLFDDLVLSVEVGVAKPQPEAYQLAVQRLGLRPNECLFIDDYDFRVEAAQAAGMQGFIYEDFEQFKRKLESLLANPDNQPLG